MAGKLDGKIAFVTGASSGIGEATALALAAEGAKVALAARRQERLEKLAKQINDNGGQAISFVTDISGEAQTNEMIQKTNAYWGSVDILVNNAGVMFLSFIDSADTSEWRRMIDINLLGLMYATHAVVPLMKDQGGGHIVNISSVAGRVSVPRYSVYNATKFGVSGFSEALRKEVYKDNIRVTVIEPGGVATELADHLTNLESKQWVEGVFQSMTLLESEDIAAATIYAVTQPPRVNVNEILIRPTEQEL
jgi:NADP-dependent 3-hydroxy acid dehydrogenase YdfG